MEVGVARADFDFDLGQLPAAALDSCCPVLLGICLSFCPALRPCSGSQFSLPFPA